MHPETRARIKAMQEEVLSMVRPKPAPVKTLRQNEGVYLNENTYWPDINYEVKDGL